MKCEQRWCGRALLLLSYKIHVNKVLQSKMHYQIIISKMYAYSESIFLHLSHTPKKSVLLNKRISALVLFSKSWSSPDSFSNLAMGRQSCLDHFFINRKWNEINTNWEKYSKSTAHVKMQTIYVAFVPLLYSHRH